MNNQPVLRAYEATVDDVVLSERSIVAKIGTGDVDRYRTVIDPAGIDLVQYRRNPIVLWEHGHDPVRGMLPVGRNLWLKQGRSGSGQLIAKTQFGKDEYSRTLFEFYRDGLLRGWSVRVLPHEGRCGPPTREERKARPELEACECVYRSSELAEYSAVAIPGNAEALTSLEERGIWVPHEAGTPVISEGTPVISSGHKAAPALPPLEGRRLEDVHRELVALIATHDERQRERLRQFADLLRGKV